MVTDGSVLSVHLFKRSKFVKINMYQRISQVLELIDYLMFWNS